MKPAPSLRDGASIWSDIYTTRHWQMSDIHIRHKDGRQSPSITARILLASFRK